MSRAAQVLSFASATKKSDAEALVAAFEQNQLYLATHRPEIYLYLAEVAQGAVDQVAPRAPRRLGRHPVGTKLGKKLLVLLAASTLV